MNSTSTQVDPKKLAEAARADYATFCCLMQEDGWFDPVHEKICVEIQRQLESTGNLQALRTGNDALVTKVFKCLVIMPRGSLKSTIITKHLNAWLSLQNPCMRSLITSNTAVNANKKLDAIRSLFDSQDLFRALFPELLPDDKCKWTSTAACVKRPVGYQEETFESAGVKTQVTGRHYNFIFEDDTVAPEKDNLSEDAVLPSIEDIDKAIGWHRTSHSLLPAKGVRGRLVVGTRWSDYDLIQYVKDKEDYYIIDVPALQVDGKPTFEIFYSVDQLDDIRKTIGSYMFSALYLNNPIPAGDRNFKVDWMQHKYKIDTVPADASYIVSLDLAISDKDTACETAAVGCFQFNSAIYVNDIEHGHFSPMETIQRALNLFKPHINKRICRLVVETVNYQKALVYFLTDELKRRGWTLPIEEVNSRASKDMRIMGLQPIYENGQIYHRQGLDPVLESQLLQYPHGRLIDVADALSMQMVVYRGVYFTPAKPPVVDTSNEFMSVLDELQRRRRPNPLSLVPSDRGEFSLLGLSTNHGVN